MTKIRNLSHNSCFQLIFCIQLTKVWHQVEQGSSKEHICHLFQQTNTKICWTDRRTERLWTGVLLGTNPSPSGTGWYKKWWADSWTGRWWRVGERIPISVSLQRWHKQHFSTYTITPVINYTLCIHYVCLM